MNADQKEEGALHCCPAGGRRRDTGHRIETAISEHERDLDQRHQPGLVVVQPERSWTGAGGHAYTPMPMPGDVAGACLPANAAIDLLRWPPIQETNRCGGRRAPHPSIDHVDHRRSDRKSILVRRPCLPVSSLPHRHLQPLLSPAGNGRGRRRRSRLHRSPWL